MKKKVLMCGSALSSGGGVVAVTQNLLNYPFWNEYEIIYIPTHIDGGAKEKIRFFVKGFKKIRYLIEHKEVTVAHLHTCDGGPFYRKGIILRYLKRHSIPVVLHHHTDYTEFFSSLRGYKLSYIKKTLRLSDANIILGKNLIDTMQKFEPLAKVSTVYNGVNTRPTREYNINGNYILFMGWLLERKGVFDLLEAVKSIDSVLNQKYKLALCGVGDDEVLSRIKAMDIDNRIEYFGWIDEDRKEKIYHNSVINILPSYREGAPMTILETMAYGIPNMASSIATIPEIIEDGKTGFLLDTHNPNKLGEVILKIINNPELRENVSQKAYTEINERFSVGRQVEEIIKLYDNLVKADDK